jgi:hypothetical protein
VVIRVELDAVGRIIEVHPVQASRKLAGLHPPAPSGLA